MSGPPGTVPVADAAARRDLAALCARLFAVEVDTDLYHSLASAEVAALLPPGVALVEPDGGDERAAVEEAAVEFCRLFIGPQPACPPYESLYRNTALLGGRTADRLRAFMVRHELYVVPPPGWPIASLDHLAVELSLLAHLLDRATGDTPAARAAAHAGIGELLDEHLRGWVPGYLDTLARSARREPYRALARLTAAVVER